MSNKFYFVTGILCGLMVLMYILQLVFPPVTYQLALNSSEFLNKPWTIISSFFIHSPSNHLHLLNNLFFLFVFGLFLERIVGSKRFAVLFFLGGIFANFSAFTFYAGSYVLGASGAISTIILTLTILRPKLVGLYLGIPMRMYLIAILWFLLNFSLLFGTGNIAAAAHLYGGIFGIIAGIYFRSREEFGEYEKKEKEEEISEKELEEWENSYMK